MKKLFKFIASKTFWTQLVLMVLVSFFLIFLINIWLKQYTRHDQKIELPNFVEKHLEDAKTLAKENNFELVVVDSIYIVGKHGSIILNQNPESGFFAKEGRKVYVTVTKHNADMIDIKSLPVLYGENYERKKKELAVGHELNSVVVGSVYDIGPEGHIMMVIFENDTIIKRRKRVRNLEIPKGATLKFVLSKSTGGLINIPDLVCQNYDAAKFLLTGYKLSIGEANADATVENFADAYVYRQEPAYDPDKKIEMGTSFTLYLTQDQPAHCSN